MRIQYKKPVDDNKYYIRIADGGYNPGIEGKPKDKHLTALANCTSFAQGRFNSIGMWEYCKYLHPKDADTWIMYAKKDKMKTGKNPKLGAVICWSGGADGCGHVAIVEQIKSKNEIICSESRYGSVAFQRTSFFKRNGTWAFKNGYNFEGFIYNPAITMKLVLALRKAVATKTATLDYDYDADGEVTMKDVLLLRKSVY